VGGRRAQLSGGFVEEATTVLGDKAARHGMAPWRRDGATTEAAAMAA